MKPVDQTHFGEPDGNCLEACVASILEIGLEEVPDFKESRDDWYNTFTDFLAGFDLEPVYLDAQRAQEIWIPTGFYIVSGPSPCGDLPHAVVGLNGKMVHDPHPDRAGLTGQEDWIIFVARLIERIPKCG